jgi:hypothetical protein
MAHIHLLATRGNLFAARQIETVVPSLAGQVTTIAYDALLRHMTRAYWWGQAKESYLAIQRHWLPGRHVVRNAGALGVRLFRCLSAPRQPKPGAYIFADLERLSPGELQKAAIVWQALTDAGAGIRLLNHPTRSMRRYELLRTLHERGINHFDAYRLTEARWPARYPVFLRREDEHGGAMSPLLRTRGELEAALDDLHRKGEVRDGLLVVEFCDTADVDGIYRKYGAFVVGDRVFARSVLFSRHWVQKRRDLNELEMLREQRQYLEENPHEAALRDIFRLARIDYGRMDYGLLHGKIQVWEINTNPLIMRLPVRQSVELQPIYEHLARNLAEALKLLAPS